MRPLPIIAGRSINGGARGGLPLPRSAARLCFPNLRGRRGGPQRDTTQKMARQREGYDGADRRSSQISVGHGYGGGAALGPPGPPTPPPPHPSSPPSTPHPRP